MEEVMRKLVILVVAITIVGAVGFAVAKSDHTKPIERGQTAMPSIEKMTLDARELPAQSFVAY
jgi:hypothetical protein